MVRIENGDSANTGIFLVRIKHTCRGDTATRSNLTASFHFVIASQPVSFQKYLCWSTSLESNDHIFRRRRGTDFTWSVVDSCRYYITIDDVVLFTALLLQMLQVRVDDPYCSCRGCVREGVSVVCGRTAHAKFGRNAESHVDRCTTTPGIDDILTCRMVQLLPDNTRSVLPLAAAVS